MKLQNKLLKVLSEFLLLVKGTFPVVLNVLQFYWHIKDVIILFAY